MENHLNIAWISLRKKYNFCFSIHIKDIIVGAITYIVFAFIDMVTDMKDVRSNYRNPYIAHITTTTTTRVMHLS